MPFEAFFLGGQAVIWCWFHFWCCQFHLSCQPRAGGVDMVVLWIRALIALWNRPWWNPEPQDKMASCWNGLSDSQVEQAHSYWACSIGYMKCLWRPWEPWVLCNIPTPIMRTSVGQFSGATKLQPLVSGFFWNFSNNLQEVVLRKNWQRVDGSG